MFDSAANRFRYEGFRLEHDILSEADTYEGKSYRAGWDGLKHDPIYDYEAWRAGKQNRSDAGKET